MNEFVRRVDETIRRRGMLKGGERIVVAVSGGPDSMALLHALHALQPEHATELHVAHFDHRLRPDSADDAQFVARRARELDLPVTIGSSTANEQERKRLSPEEAARERRLRFLEDVAHAIDAGRIATGHTLDDQAETVLMRFLHGAGARGLGGIPPVAGSFIRPLIDRTREEVEEYCRALGETPRRDTTNDSTMYLRNAIRHEVIPVLEQKVNVRLKEALARAADLLREDDAFLDALAADALDAEDGRIPVDKLLALPTALQRRVVRRALGPPGVDAAHVERILDLARKNASGDAIDLPLRLNARLEYGSLLIGRAPSPETASEVPLVVPGRTEVPWADATIVVWQDGTKPASWPDGKSVCVIDEDALRGEPIVRPRRRGDRLVPLGMKGSKTVADLFSDEKVPRARRDLVPIVATQDDVVWVAGYRVADRFRVTARTRRYLWMSIEGGAVWRS